MTKLEELVNVYIEKLIRQFGIVAERGNDNAAERVYADLDHTVIDGIAYVTVEEVLKVLKENKWWEEEAED